ncbi:transcriptional initiation protein Tat [Chitiniphilus shinanonensis]|uniref:Transcriptional initiation protein Tat n=1 Tax=Chitiniphilus shinanonensis TaxID=553088 RepID=A0ABQ6BYS3_9NEIS|nr:PhoX family phosphatase [Chitiniphilus shinanonensis]GLS06290.1 transcriptional initiation protein Tat [Chitiniphilus shinanonensis]
MSTFDHDDIPSNLSDNEHFNDVVQRVVSRRNMLKGGLGLSAAMFLGGSLAACNSSDGGSATPTPTPTPGPTPTPAPTAPKLGFTAVPAGSGHSIVVPQGYRYQVIAPWGSPLFNNSPAWKGDASDTGADQALQVGDNHDGMHFFPLTGADGKELSDEGLLVMNHEYCNYEYFFKPEAGQTYPNTWTLDKVRKAQHAHGVSVIHVKRVNGEWQVQVGSAYNRRIHGNTPMLLTGPAAGHAMLQTSADPTGTMALGTLNNCGNGWTLWGTYLTCEENFNSYFGTVNATDSRDAVMKRYGLSAKGTGYRWEELDKRFDYAQEPNESNRFGWIVEIDPWDVSSTPKKRTALGRFKHENCAMTLAKDGHVVLYMGDDQANDYVYKFVTAGVYDAANPLANRNLLDSGKLYVARFDAGAATGDMMGTGQWILLDKAANPTLAADAGFADQGAVLVKTRLAGDAVGATKMDRPEWVTVHPTTGEVYLSLTNNTGRTVPDDANPRASNAFGQIIRWRETDGDAAALTFEWDLFVLAGNPIAFPDRSDLRSGSANVTADNTFNSPDGLAFAPNGLLWIETDGSNSNTGINQGQGNNQLLVADPATKEIRRFLVGPDGCEITGITFTPDVKTVFINVQHPGEVSGPNAPVPPAGKTITDVLLADPTAFSKWPEGAPGISGAMGRPRSATVVIWKEDGGVLGV